MVLQPILMAASRFQRGCCVPQSHTVFRSWMERKPGMVQRLTTCVSLYAYCPSVGLDDCLLTESVRTLARDIVHRDVIAYRESSTQEQLNRLPYYMNDELSVDAEIGRLVQLRSASELYVTRHILSHTGCRGGTQRPVGSVANEWQTLLPQAPRVSIKLLSWPCWEPRGV